MEHIYNNMSYESQEQSETATFVLQIKFRQNKSWQGSVEWLEKKKTLNFRSALELINIIESTREQGYQVEVLDMKQEQHAAAR